MEIKSNEELKDAVKELNAMLQDPEWGTSGFCMRYGEIMNAIVIFWEEH